MNSPQDAQNLQSVFLMLLASFSMALVIVGAIVNKTGFWGGGRKGKKGGGKAAFPGSLCGRVLVITGAILLAVSLMFYWLNLAGRF